MGEETKQQAIYEFLKWREVQRKRHRVMTVGEYYAWRQGGDVLSSPTEANAFPCGLTIEYGPGVIGRFCEDTGK